MVGTGLLKRFMGTSKDRDFKRLKPQLDAVNSHELACVTMTNAELRGQTGAFRERLSRGETLDDLLPETYAVVREAAKRVIGLRPFDVQIVGGIVLHHGDIAEMVTGEGKTLVATMPLYLNALDGRGVQLVTVNDYLARRDSQWMGAIFEFLGLTVGLIQQGLNTYERQAAYRADITYGTNNEYGFDYLRDNMAVRADLRVQRELNFAIVDEVDSILIDEARTPLIISGRPEKSTDLYYKVDEAVRKLKEEEHYELEEKGNHATLTEEGMNEAEKLLDVKNLYTDDSLGVVHMIEQSIRAHNFYKRDDEYMVKDGHVNIVDEFTGRLMEGRRYGDGLHQSIEAKERVAVQFETQTIASITYQNFFKLYNKLGGMTGTAMTEAGEFDKIYSLEVFAIPTNLPLGREDLTDLIFATEPGKFRYVANEIAEVHKTGRPILVGTVSIEKSEYVGKLLEELGITTHEILNAKHHEREAVIVANAGKKGAITIATNMAGRGTDIKLAEGVRELGGLAIIGTERHESRRIDNQLRGRAGRQGDPGTTRFYVSLEDEVARLFGGDRAKKLIGLLGGDALDEEPLDQRMVTRTIEKAQQKVEEYHFEMRKHVVDYDDVMNKQREVIYKMRRDVLEDRDISELLREMFEDVILQQISEFAPEEQPPEDWDIEGLVKRLRLIFGLEFALDGKSSGDPHLLGTRFLEQIEEEYERRENFIAAEIRKAFHEQVGTDDSRVDFDKLARKRVYAFEKMALLDAVDDRWIDHLYSMDYLRDSVRLRAIGQKDPLLEYKQDGFELFQTLLLRIYEQVIQSLFRVTDPEIHKKRQLEVERDGENAKEDPMDRLMSRYDYVAADKQADSSFASFDTRRFDLAGDEQGAAPEEAEGNGRSKRKEKKKPSKASSAQTVRREGEKVKPNDPCPCGSGKKYKKCCGAHTE